MGFEDLLSQSDEQGWSAKELAHQGLVRCCLTDGKFNNCVVGFLAVMHFIRQELPSRGQDDTQPFIDLGEILKGPEPAKGIADWLSSNYR